MSVDERVDTAVVAAAQAGDEQALDDLVAAYLPLVYNIVRRALNGHADVDDVVQETMLRVVHGIDGLRDPSRFRSWLVAIAMRQVNDRWRARQGGPALLGALGSAGEVADPDADFVDVTIARLGLSGERRQVAEATAWLDPEDRRLLSLWWLEAAGELTRAELAGALRISQPHAAVRVQRMKAQLDVARVVVRAPGRAVAQEDCPAHPALQDLRPGPGAAGSGLGAAGRYRPGPAAGHARGALDGHARRSGGTRRGGLAGGRCWPRLWMVRARPEARGDQTRGSGGRRGDSDLRRSGRQRGVPLTATA